MADRSADPLAQQERTAVRRTPDRELAVTRVFDAPPPVVFRAWADPELFRRWWAPEGAGPTLVSCDMDVRTGGRYRLEFAVGGSQTLAFHGRYLEVAPDARIVWTNEEEPDGGITTVTFEEQGGGTRLSFSERHPSEAALDEAMSGSAEALPAQLDQLERLLPTLTPT